MSDTNTDPNPDPNPVQNGDATGDTTLAALAHASALVAAFLGPLIFLLLADDDDELTRENAKNALNFQIILTIAMLISGVLTVVLVGFILIPIFGIIDLIFVVIGTVKANNGEVYEYPLTPSIV